MESRHAFDLVIRGGTVYDGTGSAGTMGDVAVRGDRIVEIGHVTARGARELDAAGLAVAPGFIDVHSHDDFAVLLEPLMPFKVMQGVTTDVVGNCGSGVVPFEAGMIRFRRFHPEANPKSWDGFGGYLERVDEARPSCNVAVLMGHGSLRRGDSEVPMLTIGVDAQPQSIVEIAPAVLRHFGVAPPAYARTFTRAA